MNSTLTPEFNESFDELLEASKCLQYLRIHDATSGERINAHTRLLHARFDAVEARAHLN